jgi:hypothetical protein
MLGVIEMRERPDESWQTVELSFGADVTVEAVEAMIASVAGLPSKAVVAVDTVADGRGIRYLLHTTPATIDSLRGQWRGLLPSLSLDPSQDDSSTEWNAGAVLRLDGKYSVLRQDASAQAVAAFLGALQPLGEQEAVLCRWILSVGLRGALPEASPPRGGRSGGGSLLSLLMPQTAPNADHVRALRAKCAGPVVAGVGIVAVKAGHPERAAHLLSRVAAVARSRRGAYGGLVLRRRGPRQLARLLARRTTRGGDVYAPAELTSVIGFPGGAPRVAGLSLGSAPALMPSPAIPSEGRVLAVSTWPGLDRRLAQPVLGATCHTLLVGPTGVGKSSVIANFAVSDGLAGRGFFVLDGKGGDLADHIMGGLPECRLPDVMWLDPSADGPVPGLRLFGHGADVETTADLVLGIFESMFASTWGPMSARWLRAGLLAVAHDPQGTLADVPFVFSDDAYRRRLMARIDDPLLKSTLASFDGMSSQERQHQVAAPMGKLGEVVGRRVVRGVLAQTNPSIDFHTALRDGKIVIVSLAPARIGPAARLIAALTVYKLFEAVMQRPVAPVSERNFFAAYIDEPKVLGDIRVPLDSLFELARSANTGVVLSAQSVAQLSPDLRNAALTNAATLLAFGQNSNADAKLLAAELPGVSSETLQNLHQYECVMRIGLAPGKVSAPVTGRTLPLGLSINDPAVVRRASAERYGMDPAEVDAALAARHQPDVMGDTPIGFLRRQP